MKIVKITALSVFLIGMMSVFIMANLTKKSFYEVQFEDVMKNAVYKLDFIKQGIDDAQSFFTLLEEQSETVVVGEVIGLKKYQNVLFYEVRDYETKEIILVFSNGSLILNQDTMLYEYGTNYHYKPFFIGYEYIFFLTSFIQPSIVTNGQKVYQLSSIKSGSEDFNRYYSAYYLSEETVVLNEYDDNQTDGPISIYINNMTFNQIHQADIYYHKGVSDSQINQYVQLKTLILNRYYRSVI